MFKTVLMRFLRGALASAITTMGAVSIKQPQIWSDFHSIFTNLGIAAGYGLIVGAILGLDKLARYEK